MKNKFFLIVGIISSANIAMAGYGHGNDSAHSHGSNRVTDIAEMNHNPHASSPSSLNVKNSNTPCMKRGSELFTEINQIIEVSNGDMDKAKELLLKSNKWTNLKEENREKIAEIMFKSVANPDMVESYRQIFAEALMKQCNK